MKKRILALALVLSLVMALVIPMTALAQGQTVTGSTASAYTISTPVAFGAVAKSSDSTIVDVVTADSAAAVTIAVDDTTSAYVLDRLTSLEYILNSTTVEATITPPATGGAGQSYVVGYASATEIDMVNGNTLDLKAYTGATPGAWDPVVITLTVTSV